MARERICTCGNIIPEKRIHLGYKTCVQCSNEEMKASVDIVYHKTGNTVEIVEKEEADKINKLAKRSGFGIMSGIRGSKTNTYSPKNVQHGASLSFIGSEYESIREKILDWCEYLDYENILGRVKKFQFEKRITNVEFEHLITLLNAAFGINEPTQPNEDLTTSVNTDIEFAFKNWRNSKIYR